jgi:hypothetical protein
VNPFFDFEDDDAAVSADSSTANVNQTEPQKCEGNKSISSHNQSGIDDKSTVK